ncbi:MAG: hypothetical protein V4674_01765 [Patescibacteria group bacterium]
MKYKTFLLLAFIFLLVPLATRAQIGGFGGSELTALVFPQYPGPEVPARIVLQNFSVDLDSSTITWTINGRQVLSGMGEKELFFSTGKRGVVTRIGITVRSGNSAVTKTLSINPGSVSLLWEAQTFVPLGYKGKALPSPEATMKIVAMPHLFSGGKEVPSEKLVYTWKVDNKIKNQASGFGKNVLFYKKDLIQGGSVVSVLVSTTDGTITTEKTVELPEVEPEIHFYEESPLSGTILESTLDAGAALLEGEATVRAAPYFVSLEDISLATLKSAWSINGEIVPSGTDPFVLTLRSGEGGSGASQIGFAAENIRKILQSARNSFFITFEK